MKISNERLEQLERAVSDNVTYLRMQVFNRKFTNVTPITDNDLINLEFSILAKIKTVLNITEDD